MLPRFWKCRSSSRSCSIKKVVLKNFAIFTRLQHRFFLVNIAEFLIAPILKNFCQQLLLVNGLRRKIVEKSRREHPGRIYFERVVLTAWKVSKYGVISGPYLHTFHAVSGLQAHTWRCLLINWIALAFLWDLRNFFRQLLQIFSRTLANSCFWRDESRGKMYIKICQ